MADRDDMIRRQQVLADFGDLAIRSDDLDAVLSEACRLVADALGTNRAKVLEILPGEHELLVRAGVGWDAGVVGRVRLQMGERSSETYAIKAGEPVIMQDVATETRFEVADFMKDAGIAALVNVPILVPGRRPYGVLQVDSTSPCPFDEEDIQFLRTYAAILGPVIDRLHLLEERDEREERFTQFGDASRDILWIRDAATLQWRYLTPAFETIYGLSRDDALKGDNYRSWLDLILPEDRETATAAIDRLRGGESTTFEYRIRRPADGQVRWLRDTDFPIRGPNGDVDRIGGIGHDVTDNRAAQARIQQSEERLRSAVEVGRLGLWDWDVRSGEIHWSDEHFRMEGYAVGEVTPSYQAWADRIHPDDRPGAEAALRAAMEGRHEFAHEFRTVHPDGTVRWLAGRGSFFYGEDGAPVRMVGSMIDTTERRQWEDRQKVLIAELQHRTRNLLGVVRSISDKTLRASDDLAQFREAFHARLDALGRVQGLLSRLGDADRVTFDALIRSELEAMNGASDRVTLDGPDGIRLRSSTVQTLAMALHELATNANKYGALGQKDGRLAVRWTLTRMGDERRPWIEIDWRESGVTMPGPEAAERFGAGRELIERALPYQLNARTTYRLEPDGVHATIAVPVSASTAEAPDDRAGQDGRDA
ncbi:histidine kinase [Nostoc sp. 3335mG]|nr:histidine kinase [Nostoc sp. 3335mG]